ncbi:hypothetical protein UPYG_G00326470 [Umbra pygmaea]|uniref:Secreted protein n=1 Tax=Umbra pygmaea TaxID=75934 RepID=A0ABD0W1C0_UMBPY
MRLELVATGALLLFQADVFGTEECENGCGSGAVLEESKPRKELASGDERSWFYPCFPQRTSSALGLTDR